MSNYHCPKYYTALRKSTWSCESVKWRDVTDLVREIRECFPARSSKDWPEIARNNISCLDDRKLQNI